MLECVFKCIVYSTKTTVLLYKSSIYTATCTYIYIYIYNICTCVFVMHQDFTFSPIPEVLLV